jgi:hypothetical protein
MLKDPKAEALVKNFAGNWLWSRALEDAQPNPELFPTANAALRSSMQQETELFFQAFLQEDRSALELLRSDFTYLNDALATHYGLPAVGSSTLQRTAVSGQRGGLLTQAGVLTVTSQPNRTSPVKRGKWVLAQLMCDEPPPPPPEVEGLQPQVNPTASLREQMEQHRANPTCAGCHSTMDPIGFGLENFDAVGRWRTKDVGNFDIDASGQLPSGQSFNGHAELANILQGDARFAQCITDQLFTYALGRGLTDADSCSVQKLSLDFTSRGHRLSELIVLLATSDAFTQRRGEEVKP